MSSKSHIGRVWPAMKAIDLADVERRAAAEGDDAVVAAGAIGREPGVDVARRPGCPGPRNTRGRPAGAVERFERRGEHRQLATPGSVTSSGRAIAEAFSASGSSAMRPAPKRIAVG